MRFLNWLGFNEVEDIVSRHDKVQNCAVIGFPDEKTGEAVKLFIIPGDKSLTAEEVNEYCRLKLTTYKVPKQVEFTMTLVGKILRKDLRAEKKREIAF